MLERLRRDTRGANLVEYIVLVAVALIALAGFRKFGGVVYDKVTGQGAQVAALEANRGGPAEVAPGGATPAQAPAQPTNAAPPRRAASQTASPRVGTAQSGIARAVEPFTDDAPSADSFVTSGTAAADGDPDKAAPPRPPASPEPWPSNAIVPESPAAVQQYLDQLSKNRKHVKQIAVDEAGAKIDFKLDRAAHFAGYSDASVPIKREKLAEAKAFVSQFVDASGKPKEGASDNGGYATTLYTWIRRKP